MTADADPEIAETAHWLDRRGRRWTLGLLGSALLGYGACCAVFARGQAHEAKLRPTAATTFEVVATPSAVRLSRGGRNTVRSLTVETGVSQPCARIVFSPYHARTDLVAGVATRFRVDRSSLKEGACRGWSAQPLDRRAPSIALEDAVRWHSDHHYKHAFMFLFYALFCLSGLLGTIAYAWNGARRQRERTRWRIASEA